LSSIRYTTTIANYYYLALANFLTLQATFRRGQIVSSGRQVLEGSDEASRRQTKSPQSCYHTWSVDVLVLPAPWCVVETGCAVKFMSNLASRQIQFT